MIQCWKYVHEDDDGFDWSSIKRIFGKKFPEGVEVKDFGTSGLKLAYDLMKVVMDWFFSTLLKGGESREHYIIEPNEKT